VDVRDFRQAPFLKVPRPLVGTYLAFSRTASRHITSLKPTTSQFDVIATLRDTDERAISQNEAEQLRTLLLRLQRSFQARTH
jgi:hypothetical protein